MTDGESRPGRETFWITNTMSFFPQRRATPVFLWDSRAINERSASLCNARSKGNMTTTIPKTSAERVNAAMRLGMKLLNRPPQAMSRMLESLERAG